MPERFVRDELLSKDIAQRWAVHDNLRNRHVGPTPDVLWVDELVLMLELGRKCLESGCKGPAEIP